MKHLLERNADYKVADGNGATALHYAAQSNFANTVEVFLSFPFIRDIPDNEGKSALMWAASKGKKHYHHFHCYATSNFVSLCEAGFRLPSTMSFFKQTVYSGTDKTTITITWPLKIKYFSVIEGS